MRQQRWSDQQVSRNVGAGRIDLDRMRRGERSAHICERNGLVDACQQQILGCIDPALERGIDKGNPSGQEIDAGQ